MLPVEEVDAAVDIVRYSSYVGLPLFVLGLIGNGILIRLMIKREVRRYSSSIFLLGLAITDTIVLFYEVADDIAVHIPSIRAYDILYGYDRWRCRVGVFVYQTVRTISAWLVVGMAAELCVAAMYPSKRRVVYFRNRTMYVSLAVVLVSIAAGFPFLVLARETKTDSKVASCTSDYEVFYLVYSEFVLKGATQCLFPIVFVVVCNLISYFSLAREKEEDRNDHKYMSAVDRRGVVRGKAIQAKNTIYVLTILYVLTVTPTTVAQLFIMVRRFYADFGYTHFWNVVMNTTSVIYIANYAVKFYCIVLFGREYRGAFAGRLNLYEDHTDNIPTLIPNGVIPNGGHDVKHLSDIHLDVRPTANSFN